MYPKKIAALVEDMLADPESSPSLYLWGPPGVGKSAVPKGIAAKRHIGFVDLRAPLRDPTDLRGIPTVVGNHAVWLAPTDLPTDNFCMGCKTVLHELSMEVAVDTKGKSMRKEEPNGMVTGVTCKLCGSTDVVWKGIQMDEELSSAPLMTQVAFYQLVLDKQIGEYHFPKGWIQIATSNRIEDRAIVNRTSTALLNRFFHVDYDHSVDDWVEWGLTDGHIDPNIIGYVKWRGDVALFNFKPESSERAFATPRSLEAASKLIHLVRSREVLVEVLEGCTGKAWTADFIAFLKVQTELPALEPILQGTSSYVPPQNRMDLKYALVSALASRADAKKHYNNLIKYTKHLPEEFAVLLITMMVSIDKSAVMTAPDFGAFALAHQDVILTKRP